MKTSLIRVLQGCSGRTAGEWSDASSQLAAQRQAVERLLSTRPAPRVYGFNTLLGQLDSAEVDQVDQRALIAAHLVGGVYDLPDLFSTVVTACKIEQIHRGGSGVSPACYQMLLNRISREPTGASVSGAWSSSYGSGDVVPAAWWLDNLLRGDGSGAQLAAGDSIALINGSFYSSAVAVLALASAAGSAARFAVHVAELCELPADPAGQPDRGRELVDLLRSMPAAGGDQNPNRGQTSVIRRDGRPFLDALTRALCNTGAAVDHRLSAPSANPMFIDVDGDFRAVSQSSFLEFGLTFSLTSVMQFLHLALAVTQRFVLLRSEQLLAAAGGADQQFVQPPKIANAAVEEAVLTAGVLPARFVGTDSDGVEDARDLSLLTARQVISLSVQLGRQLDQLDGLCPARDQARLAAVRRCIIETVVEDEGRHGLDLVELERVAWRFNDGRDLPG